MALLHLAAGVAAGSLLWGIAVWDAPAPVGGLRGAILLAFSAGAGLVAGFLAMVASVIRRAAFLGMGRPGLDIIPARWRKRGRRSAGWVMTAAGLVAAIDAALLYLFLY